MMLRVPFASTLEIARSRTALCGIFVPSEDVSKRSKPSASAFVPPNQRLRSEIVPPVSATEGDAFPLLVTLASSAPAAIGKSVKPHPLCAVGVLVGTGVLVGVSVFVAVAVLVGV